MEGYTSDRKDRGRPKNIMAHGSFVKDSTDVRYCSSIWTLVINVNGSWMDNNSSSSRRRRLKSVPINTSPTLRVIPWMFLGSRKRKTLCVGVLLLWFPVRVNAIKDECMKPLSSFYFISLVCSVHLFWRVGRKHPSFRTTIWWNTRHDILFLSILLAWDLVWLWAMLREMKNGDSNSHHIYYNCNNMTSKSKNAPLPLLHL